MPKFMSFEDLRKAGINYSPATLRRHEAAGLFPKRHFLGPRRTVWLESEITTHLEGIVSKRKSRLSA